MDKKIGAAYIRVSTDDQLEYSPESQIKLIQEYAKQHDIIVPEEYIFRDDGISGRTAKKRPGFMQMIATAKQKPRPFEVILVWKFSRFARNQEESVVYKSLLKKENGIEVVSISEPLMEGPFGDLIERIIEWFDAFYSINLATEVRRGMTERVMQGGTVSVAPLGYVLKDKQLLIEPSEAETVRMIYDDYLSGQSIIGIAKKLNDLGIKTKRGGTWQNRTVRYILTNPVYIGKVRWSPKGINNYHKYNAANPDTIITDGKHDPIIDNQVFDAAQKKIADQVDIYHSASDLIARREDGTYMLQGIVKCSACGATLTRSGHVYMQCSKYTHGTCTQSHNIRIDTLEQLVLSAMSAQFAALDFNFAQKPAKAANQDSAILQQIKKEQDILQRCKEAYAAGVDTLEEYRRNKIACKARIDQLQAKIAKPQKPIDKAAFAAKHYDALQKLKDKNTLPAEKNRLINTFVDHITYFKELQTIDIVYKA